jgi:hypothetical protein
MKLEDVSGMEHRGIPETVTGFGNSAALHSRNNSYVYVFTKLCTRNTGEESGRKVNRNFPEIYSSL